MDRIDLGPIIVGGMPVQDVVFWPEKDQYLVRENQSWTRYSEKNVMLRLKRAGLNPRVVPGQDISEAHEALHTIQTQRQVDHACPLAGWESGLYNSGGRRILVTESTEVLQAVEKPFPHLRKFLEELLGKQAFDHHVGWWQWARRSITGMQNLPGQIMVYIGKAGAGKSLLQKAITTKLLGGRDCTPYDYMAGKSNFNEELFECQHLIIEDQFFARGIDARREFGAKMKELAVNGVVRCHGKFKTGLTLSPKWRTSISLNDERENMNVLPPLDDSLIDKVMLFRCGQPDYPCDLGTLEGWRQWDAIMKDELPGLAHHIDNAELGDLTGKRYGVLPWHDKSLLEQECETAPEQILMQILSHDLPQWEQEKAVWHGTALDLERILTANHMPSRDQARKILHWPAACGTYLGRLAKSGSVVTKKISSGRSVWTIDLEALRAQNDQLAA